MALLKEQRLPFPFCIVRLVTVLPLLAPVKLLFCVVSNSKSGLPLSIAVVRLQVLVTVSIVSDVESFIDVVLSLARLNQQWVQQMIPVVSDDLLP